MEPVESIRDNSSFSKQMINNSHKTWNLQTKLREGNGKKKMIK